MFPYLGLESTPQEYVGRMVEIFRDVYRVLRDDGVCFLNLGDSYAGSGGENANTGLGSKDRSNLYRANPRKERIAPGNLIFIPHRIALALQADGAADPVAMRTISRIRTDLLIEYDSWDAVPDRTRSVIERLDREYADAHKGGWIVRQDLVWDKVAPMPESVAGWRWRQKRSKKASLRHSDGRRVNTGGVAIRDVGNKPFNEYEYGDDYVLRKGSWRHTRAHEFIFMLTKKMGYFCNQEAVREASNPKHLSRYKYDFWPEGTKEASGSGRPSRASNTSGKKQPNSAGRNPRSVLRVPTSSYKHAHYATYPPNLIAPFIRAACPRWACPVCGQGWAPVVETQAGFSKECPKTQSSHEARGGSGIPSGTVGKSGSGRTDAINSIIGYRPTCKHEHTKEEAVPGIVLDPFIGSGTTGAVARELQRRWIGLDISIDYLDQQAKPRALFWTPSDALEGLPLFEIEEAEDE